MRVPNLFSIPKFWHCRICIYIRKIWCGCDKDKSAISTLIKTEQDLGHGRVAKSPQILPATNNTTPIFVSAEDTYAVSEIDKSASEVSSHAPNFGTDRGRDQAMIGSPKKSEHLLIH